MEPAFIFALLMVSATFLIVCCVGGWVVLCHRRAKLRIARFQRLESREVPEKYRNPN